MTTVNFEFKEEKHWYFFVEFLIGSAINYVEAKKKLEAEIKELRDAVPAPVTHMSVLTLDMAKEMLKKEGYIFYKKPKNFGGGGHKKEIKNKK